MIKYFFLIGCLLYFLRRRGNYRKRKKERNPRGGRAFSRSWSHECIIHRGDGGEASERERQADESAARGGGSTRTLVAEANHATAEPKSPSSEPPGGGKEGGGEGMTTGGRPRAERSCMAFLKSPEKTRSVARRCGGGGKGEGVATWFPSARLHTYTRERARAYENELPGREVIHCSAETNACSRTRARRDPRFRARSACARSSRRIIVT